MRSAARTLASGSAVRVVTLVLGIGVGFLIVPFMIHRLGDRAYGLWTVVGVVVGYYGMLDLGLSRALGRFVARALARGEVEESNRLFNTGLLLYSLMGLVVLVTALGVAAFADLIWSKPEDAALFAPLVLILGFNMGLGFPVRAFGGVLQARLRFDLAAGFELLTLVLQNSLVVWILLSGHGLVALAWVMVLGAIPQKCLLVYFARRELPSLRVSARLMERETARQIFSFSFYLFVQRLSQLLRFQTAPLVLSAFVGLAAVTHFRVASLLINYFRKLMIACFGMLLPLFSMQDGRGDTEALEESFLFSIRLSIGLASLVAFGLVAWGEPFLTVWMGEAYLDAYPVLVVLALSALIMLGQSTFPTVMLSRGRERLVALLSAAHGVATLVLSIVLVQSHGMLGVALGVLVPTVAMGLVVQPAVGCPAIGISYGRYFSQLGATSLRAAVCLLPALALTASFVAPDVLSLLGVAIGSAGAYLLGFWFTEFSRADRRRMLDVVRPSLRRRRETAETGRPV